MAAIEGGIRIKLAGTAAIQAIVGSTARIYPVELPQGVTYPALVYTRISGAPVQSMGGASALQHMRLQIDCYAASYSAVKGLADAVNTALNDFSGTVTGGTIDAASLISEQDLSAPELELYRVSLDYSIWFSET